jgi:hypothetical protein
VRDEFEKHARLVARQAGLHHLRLHDQADQLKGEIKRSRRWLP